LRARRRGAGACGPGGRAQHRQHAARALRPQDPAWLRAPGLHPPTPMKKPAWFRPMRVLRFGGVDETRTSLCPEKRLSVNILKTVLKAFGLDHALQEGSGTVRTAVQ